MTNRIDIIHCLRQLEELSQTSKILGPKSSKFAALHAEIDAMRLKLPTAILKHYDQRHARNKPAIAAVKRGVCVACHISLTRNSTLELRRAGGTIGVCENCGVFIYLDDSEANGPAVQSAR
jgi:predicted  nucleic acid-binding Zn-ribbon protein